MAHIFVCPAQRQPFQVLHLAWICPERVTEKINNLLNDMLKVLHDSQEPDSYMLTWI